MIVVDVFEHVECANHVEIGETLRETIRQTARIDWTHALVGRDRPGAGVGFECPDITESIEHRQIAASPASGLKYLRCSGKSKLLNDRSGDGAPGTKPPVSAFDFGQTLVDLGLHGSKRYRFSVA